MTGIMERTKMQKKQEKLKKQQEDRERDRQFYRSFAELRARNGLIDANGRRVKQPKPHEQNQWKQDNALLKEYQSVQREYQMKDVHKADGLKQPVTNEFVRQRAVSRYESKQQPPQEKERVREQDALAL